MKTNYRNLLIAPFWLIVTVFIFVACSTEKMDELEDSVFATESIGLMEGVDLKKGNAEQNKLLAQIRAATAKYQQLAVAEADGYVLDPHCVEHPELGGMGNHAVNMGRIVPFVNHLEPGVLVYEPTRNGRYRLVAVEYLVPAEPWDAMNDGPPMLGMVEFDDHREIIFVPLLDDEGNEVLDEEGDPVLIPVNAKGGPPFPHYQLHVWVWKNNPNGMYTPFNPTVNCDFAGH